MRSWQSYIINGILRLTSKRRMPLDPDFAKLRLDYERLDARRFRLPPDTVTETAQANGISCQWLRVPDSQEERVLYYLHGGGFVFRFPQAHSAMLARWCRRLDSQALMPDYRLAPEHPYPAAPQDCLSGYRWLLDQSYTPENIVIAGDSAGGCLALATLYGIKQEGLPMPACAVLLSPGTDLTLSGCSIVNNERKDPMFTLQAMLTMRTAYASEEQMCEPSASPLYADYSGFPPLQFVTGSSEILLDDSLRAAAKARRAEVEVDLHIWDGMPHVFPVISFLPESRKAIEQITRFVSRHTGWNTFKPPA
jgi:acetyl esterase/lipase